MSAANYAKPETLFPLASRPSPLSHPSSSSSAALFPLSQVHATWGRVVAPRPHRRQLTLPKSSEREGNGCQNGTERVGWLVEIDVMQLGRRLLPRIHSLNPHSQSIHPHTTESQRETKSRDQSLPSFFEALLASSSSYKTPTKGTD